MNTVVLRSSFVVLAAVSAVGGTSRPASACGGCFVRPTENTVVTDHRMAFSISSQQTVLWDQIKYGGNPTDFSWVLPVRAGAVVELSHDEWFAALDALTAPVIAGPTTNCSQGGGVGCGGSSSSASGHASSDPGSVQVISQSVVGPYETVTLRSTDANALETWLTVNGYALPASIRPTVDAYVAAAFDFIALRLQPGQGVQAMQPVRVVTQGADATLPLRMVAAGVGAQVGVTLYVIGEGRYEAKPPFFNAVVYDSQLFWRQQDNRSNYQELSQQLMQQNRGRTWLTEYSQVSSPSTNVQSSLICQPTAYYGTSSSLAELYLSQCRCAAPKPCAAASPPDASLTASDAAPVQEAAEASVAAEASDTTEAASDATQASDVLDSAEASNEAGPDHDAVADSRSADGPPAAPDATCSAGPCTGFDDLDRALVGLHPSDVWVTRLRAILPVDALSEGDLQLQASVPQSTISNYHTAKRYEDPAYDPCGNRGGGCSASATDSGSFETWFAVGALGFAGVALSRRRRSP